MHGAAQLATQATPMSNTATHPTTRGPVLESLAAMCAQCVSPRRLRRSIPLCANVNVATIKQIANAPGVPHCIIEAARIDDVAVGAAPQAAFPTVRVPPRIRKRGSPATVGRLRPAASQLCTMTPRFIAAVAAGDAVGGRQMLQGPPPKPFPPTIGAAQAHAWIPGVAGAAVVSKPPPPPPPPPPCVAAIDPHPARADAEGSHETEFLRRA